MEQKRLYLAMLLSGLILVVWQVLMPAEPPQPVEEEQVAAKVAGDEPAAAAGDTSAGAQNAEAQDAEARAEAAVPAPRRDIPVRQDSLVGEFLRVGLTNKAASVTSAHILKPEQYAGEEPGDLVGFPAGAPEFPFQISFVGGSIALDDNAVFEVVEQASQKSKSGDAFEKLVYRYHDPQGRFRVDKTFSVNPELPYVIDMDVEITNLGAQGSLKDSLALDILGWKDPEKKSSFLDFNPVQVEGVCRTPSDTEREKFSSLEKESARFAKAEVMWGAVDTRYFMLAALPEEPAASCEMDVVHANYVRTRLVSQPFTIEAGNSVQLSNRLFMGPKVVDVLHEVGSDLSRSVDYGIFAFVARPMRWGLNELFKLVGNWGLAIILLTFLIRGALWPVNMKAYSSMERMKAVQPLLNELKEKYKDDRQRQTEETMKLFKKHNVNPAGGCLPMLLQMPVLYGLYVCIYNSVDLYNAHFILWYDNLAAPDPYFVLPILMGVAMVLQQRMSTVDTPNKQAAMMMKIMPVMFTAFMLFLPSGLVLYYALSLVLGVAQQYFIRKKFAAEPPLAAD